MAVSVVRSIARSAATSPIAGGSGRFSDIISEKQQLEKDLQAWIEANPEREERYLSAIKDVEALVAETQSRQERGLYYGFLAQRSSLLSSAKTLYRLSLEMQTDVKRAAATDEIEAALDYKSIAKEIIRVVETSEFKLVETLAETLARIVVTDFGVAWVKLSVSKPGAIEGSRNVGVRIERTADDYA